MGQPPRCQLVLARRDGTGWHLLGTAMMGNNRRSSVVDRWGRSQDIATLFIIDGSVWPTSAGMNPTVAIAALAVRLVDHLIDERLGQPMPR